MLQNKMAYKGCPSVSNEKLCVVPVSSRSFCYGAFTPCFPARALAEAWYDVPACQLLQTRMKPLCSSVSLCYSPLPCKASCRPCIYTCMCQKPSTGFSGVSFRDRLRNFKDKNPQQGPLSTYPRTRRSVTGYPTSPLMVSHMCHNSKLIPRTWSFSGKPQG